jgi:hypothetical protein
MTTPRLKLMVCLALLVGGAMAQSIAPPIAEYRGSKADGMFALQNTTDYSMMVLLETRNFEVDDHGQVIYRPLDANIEIKMGANSFLLRAHDSRMIFYKATFPAAPVSFSIVATMTKAGEVKGLRINYILPHMIYVYQKEKLEQSDVKVEVSNGTLRIQNLSHKLGRVGRVQVAKQELGGFPLFPEQTREMPISAGKVNVEFEDGFKVGVQ